MVWHASDEFIAAMIRKLSPLKVTSERQSSVANFTAQLAAKASACLTDLGSKMF